MVVLLGLASSPPREIGPLGGAFSNWQRHTGNCDPHSTRLCHGPAAGPAANFPGGLSRRSTAEQNKNRLVVDAQENLGTLTVDPMRLRHC
jgi:hypothetical protein